MVADKLIIIYSFFHKTSRNTIGMMTKVSDWGHEIKEFEFQ